jgi:hypothetical protein
MELESALQKEGFQKLNQNSKEVNIRRLYPRQQKMQCQPSGVEEILVST